jgi:hypothetical protein
MQRGGEKESAIGKRKIFSYIRRRDLADAVYHHPIESIQILTEIETLKISLIEVAHSPGVIGEKTEAAIGRVPVLLLQLTIADHKTSTIRNNPITICIGNIIFDEREGEGERSG